MTLFRTISSNLLAKQKRTSDKRELESSILLAASTGTLQDAELQGLRERFKNLRLASADIRIVRVKAYTEVVATALAKGTPTADDQVRLDRIQQFLMIPDGEIKVPKGSFYRMRLIVEIKSGNFPSTSVPDVVLQKGETAYWSERGALMEERVVSRGYEGASQGVSMRITKRLTYRVAAQRGHVVSKSATVPVSSGLLIITNQRLIFAGDDKSFSIRFDKLLEVHPFSNGLFCSDQTGKSHEVCFSSPDNVAIVAVLLGQAIHSFESKS